MLAEMRRRCLALGKALECLALLALLSAGCKCHASDLDELQARAIPVGSHTASAAVNYHDIPFDAANPLASEPLVEIKDYGIAGEAFYARRDSLNAPYFRCICPEDSPLKLRKTVAQKLKRIDERLAPFGLELFVFDAYRPQSCQQSLWKFFIEEARRMLGADAPQAKLVAYAETYCANPTKFDRNNWRTWSDHPTGGAVDLTLRRKNGELLFMGGVFDDDSDLSTTAHFEKQKGSEKTPEPLSVIQSRQNRRMLYGVMQDEGFGNYPSEWWHYEYGTQPWAKYINQKKAIYGVIP